MKYAELQHRLGYQFKNLKLLKLALMHPSANSSTATHLAYERLEFLGDAVLQLAVTQYLYHHLPGAAEGELTHLRARIVSRANLGKYGFILNLDRYITLGKGEEKAGGRTKHSIIANTFESVFGAMSLDSDFETTKTIALRILQTALDSAEDNPKEINPKGELQTILQDIRPVTPVYETHEAGERDSDDRFHAQVFWQDRLIGAGTGTSKRRAEVAAALDALEHKVWESAKA